ncbi:DUF6161 domain-containing protein [Marivirga tractuosa]|uniref:DUF6161 domain-containing protein n=1 Tax=Marivirga tractuosa TaxID=1006 RepID=UPI0035CECB9F
METNKKVVEIINKSGNKDWFNNLELKIDYKYISNGEISKDGFLSIYAYFRRQYNGWGKYEVLPNELSKSKSIFNLITNKLDQILNSSTSEINQLNRLWSEIVNQTNNFQRNLIIPYDIPETSFLIDLHKDADTLCWTGAYDFLVQRRLNNNSFIQRDYYEGTILGYEFRNKDSIITKRRNKEKATFTQLRNELENQFTQSELSLREHIEHIDETVNDSIQKQENLQESKNIGFDEWFNKTKEEKENSVTEYYEKIKQLENTYEEKLKLEKPADYWDQRAKALRKDGWKWLNWLIGFTVGGAILFFLLLILITTGDIENIFSKVGTAIKWSIVLITFVSFIAFGIRTFAKLAYSSFHLVRDAEERKHLVYVFLALSNEKDLDKEERNLIIQSIFSRSDSGLLREESSPTMPGSTMFFEKLFK